MVIVEKVNRAFFERIKRNVQADHLLTTLSITLDEMQEWSFAEEDEEMRQKVNRWLAKMLVEPAGILVLMSEDAVLGIEV